MLKRVGTRARVAISELIGAPVHLTLHVRTRKGWIDDDSLLDEARVCTVMAGNAR